MLPIAPPALSPGHHNRQISCQSALQANFVALLGGPTADLLAAAVFEGWTSDEAGAAIDALGARG